MRKSSSPEGLPKAGRAGLIALLTDFGLSDAYVPSMKGIILSIAPEVTIVDITHSIAHQNIDEAAFVLWRTYKYFPKGTIFVCVVDPGVGSVRKILCAESANYYFLAPDNGLLRFILGEERIKRFVSVENTTYFRKEISSIFHGRDIFAPVAAHLSKGVSVSKLGARVTPSTASENFVVIRQKGKYKGKIIHVDHFGNLVTNFLLEMKSNPKNSLRVGKYTVNEFHKTYSEARAGIPFLIIGSANLIEVSVKNGNASKALHVKLNQPVQLIIK